MQALFDWLRAHPGLVSAVTAVSIVTFVGSLLAVPILVGRIPADYFARPEPPTSGFRTWHPALRVALVAVKNLFGVVLLALGLLMLFTPGQGLLTIFVGLLLIDGPGKRRLELFVVRRAAVRRSLAWLRRRRGRPPLEIWDPDADPR